MSMANSNKLEKGEEVSIADIVQKGTAKVESKRGNIASRKARKGDPAVKITREGNDVVKLAHELNEADEK